MMKCLTFAKMFALTSAICITLAACSALERKTVAESRVEAGSVKMSVISVAPWEEVVADLKPVFGLTAAQALESSLPNAALFNSRRFRAFAANLGISSLADNPGVTTKTTKKADGTEVTEITESSLVASGDSTVDGLKELPPAFEKLTEFSPKIDPIINYKAATTLYQEVKLLETYLDHAVISDRYEPYLVRLQIAVLPHLRNQPFDIFTDLHFLHEIDDFRLLPKVIPLVVTDSLESARENELTQVGRRLSLLLGGEIGGTPAQSDIQSLSNRLDELQTVDLNSLFTISQINDNAVRLRLGARYDGGNRYEMTARTHNVTLLVNVPICRNDRCKDLIDEGGPQLGILALNKMRDARTGKILKDGQKTNKEFRDKIEDLAEQFPNIKDRKDRKEDGIYWTNGEFCVGKKGENGRIKIPGTKSTMRKLLGRYVLYNDYKTFSQALQCMTEDRDVIKFNEMVDKVNASFYSFEESMDKDIKDKEKKNDNKRLSLRDEQILWSELSSLAGMIPADKVVVDLPLSRAVRDTYNNFVTKPVGTVFFNPAVDGYTVDGVMIDDPKKSTTVKLPLKANIDAKRLTLLLEVEGKQNGTNGYRFAAENAEVNDEMLTATFPSLKALRPGGFETAKLVASVKPLSWQTNVRPGKAEINIRLLNLEPSQAKPALTIVPVGIKVLDPGEDQAADLALDFRFDDKKNKGKKIGIKISGAQFKEDGPASGFSFPMPAPADDDRDFIVGTVPEGNGRVNLHLVNISSPVPITVDAGLISTSKDGTESIDVKAQALQITIPTKAPDVEVEETPDVAKLEEEEGSGPNPPAAPVCKQLSDTEKEMLTTKEECEEIQRKLCIEADGDFGTDTRRAIKAWQEETNQFKPWNGRLKIMKEVHELRSHPSTTCEDAPKPSNEASNLDAPKPSNEVSNLIERITGEGRYALIFRHAENRNRDEPPISLPQQCDESYHRKKGLAPGEDVIDLVDRLSSEGVDQAECIRSAVGNLGIRISDVYSSDYCRTARTADVIFKDVIADIKIDPNLNKTNNNLKNSIDKIKLNENIHGVAIFTHEGVMKKFSKIYKKNNSYSRSDAIVFDLDKNSEDPFVGIIKYNEWEGCDG